MLLSRNVNIKCCCKNKRYLEKELGRSVQINEEVTLPVIKATRSAEVRVQCDFYHNTVKTMPYGTYYDRYASQNQPYACFDCVPAKRQKNYEEKNRLGLLSPGDNSYYTFKENILRDLKKYIEDDSEHKVPFAHCKLYGPIKRMAEENEEDYKKFLNRLLAEIGYSEKDIMKTMPAGYWNDIEHVKARLTDFINKHGYFPNQKEIVTMCGIGGDIIKNHGGITKLKVDMKYDDKKGKIDKNGNLLMSRYECIMSNYFILRNITVQWYSSPFKGKKFTSDASFTVIADPIIYHVELWGFDPNGKSKEAIKYNQNRKIKEGLYANCTNKIKLISVESSVFTDSKTHSEIIEKLDNIFSQYINLTSKYVADEESYKVLYTSPMSDEELCLTAIKYIEPDTGLLNAKMFAKGCYRIYEEVMKRYGSVAEFALKLDLNIKF